MPRDLNAPVWSALGLRGVLWLCVEQGGEHSPGQRQSWGACPTNPEADRPGMQPRGRALSGSPGRSC